MSGAVFRHNYFPAFFESTCLSVRLCCLNACFTQENCRFKELGAPKTSREERTNEPVWLKCASMLHPGVLTQRVQTIIRLNWLLVTMASVPLPTPSEVLSQAWTQEVGSKYHVSCKEFSLSLSPSPPIPHC